VIDWAPLYTGTTTDTAGSDSSGVTGLSSAIQSLAHNRAGASANAETEARVAVRHVHVHSAGGPHSARNQTPRSGMIRDRSRLVKESCAKMAQTRRAPMIDLELCGAPQ
jgi:hypothetical protein